MCARVFTCHYLMLFYDSQAIRSSLTAFKLLEALFSGEKQEEYTWSVKSGRRMTSTRGSECSDLFLVYHDMGSLRLVDSLKL